MSQINPVVPRRAFRLLIAGINWPTETFIARLIDGLVEAGGAGTIGTASRPKGKKDRVQWLRTPSWETGIPLRLVRLAAMAIRAKVRGTRDMKVFGPFVRRGRTFSRR